jgi:flagellar protein FliS
VAGTALDRYQENEVMAQSPARRVVLLYAQLLANMRRAARAMAASQIEVRSDCLLRAQNMVHELLVSLDPSAAAPLAERLAAIYRHLWRELIEVNRGRDAARLEKLIQQVTALHEAWEAAARSVDGRDTPSGTAL